MIYGIVYYSTKITDFFWMLGCHAVSQPFIWWTNFRFEKISTLWICHSVSNEYSLKLDLLESFFVVLHRLCLLCPSTTNQPQILLFGKLCRNWKKNIYTKIVYPYLNNANIFCSVSVFFSLVFFLDLFSSLHPTSNEIQSKNNR